MHNFFYSFYIFFAIRDSHIGDIKLKNTFLISTQIQLLTTRVLRRESRRRQRKNRAPIHEQFTRIHKNRAVQKKNKMHTYKLHAARKGCTQSHKILTLARDLTHTRPRCLKLNSHTLSYVYVYTHTRSKLKKTFHVLEKCFSLQQPHGKSSIANTSR